MIEEQLIKYINDCKSKNISDDEIKKNLQEHGWPIKMIQEALNINVSINPPPINLTDNKITNDSSSAERPRILKIISILFFLIAFMFYFSSYGTIILLLTINHAMSQAFDPPFVILKAMPILGILPLLGSLGATIITYAGLKIKNGSKKSFWFGLISLIFVVSAFLILGFITGASMAKIQTNLNNL